MMCKLYIFLVICCVGLNVRSQTVSNVRLVDHISYFTKLMQESMSDIERRGWHTFQMTQWTDVLNSNIYGWELQGNVTYKNGFVVGLQSMHLVTPTTQVWGPANTTPDNTDRVSVDDTLSLNEISVGYDVQVDLDDGQTHHFTGIYTHENIRFMATIEKNLHRNEFTASVRVTSVSGGTARRILFLPANNIGEVLQRSFLPSSSWDGAESWAQQIAAVMEQKATNIVQFPEICYNCAA